MKKTPLMIQVDQVDRCRIEMLSARWGGVSLSATVRRVLEEYVQLVDNSVQQAPVPSPEPEPQKNQKTVLL